MSYLRAESRIPNQAQSTLIKANQAIFLNRNTRQSIRSNLHQSTGDFVFHGPRPAPIRAKMSSQDLRDFVIQNAMNPAIALVPASFST
jgi:hypothetical protein